MKKSVPIGTLFFITSSRGYSFAISSISLAK